MISHGDRLAAVVSADRVEVVRSKANAAKDDWNNLMDNLKQRETVLQVQLEQGPSFFYFSLNIHFGSRLKNVTEPAL